MPCQLVEILARLRVKHKIPPDLSVGCVKILKDEFIQLKEGSSDPGNKDCSGVKRKVRIRP